MLLPDAGALPPDLSPEQIQALIERYVSWRQKVATGRGRVGSPTVTDGPFAESCEVIGGIFMVEAASFDEVVELSKDCPHLDFGTIEFREVKPT